MRNRGFYAHNRGRYFVQQGGGGAASSSPSFNFVAPSTNNGQISVIIEDGAGGWYIGGSFTSITDSVGTYDTGYTRLVRLRPDGTIDPGFSCPVNSTVSAMALDSTGLYIGGLFSGANAVGTSTRDRIARVRPFNDPAPGAVDAWRPDADGSVQSLILDSANGKLYIGGSFGNVGGSFADFASTPRIRIARVTTGATASLDGWRPDATGTSSQVLSMQLDSVNGKLYFAGRFTNVGGSFADFASTPRIRIARVTTGATASLDGWRPDATAITNITVSHLILDSANGKLYIGGSFTDVGGSFADFASTPRNRIARVTTGATASLDGWDPNVSTASSSVFDMALDSVNGFLYIGGRTFTTVSGSTRNRLARVTTGLTSTLDAWHPDVSLTADDASVLSILLYPGLNRAIVVGNFDAIANQVDTSGNDIAGLII